MLRCNLDRTQLDCLINVVTTELIDIDMNVEQIGPLALAMYLMHHGMLYVDDRGKHYWHVEIEYLDS